jgi:hypothetical protein
MEAEVTWRLDMVQDMDEQEAAQRRRQRCTAQGAPWRAVDAPMLPMPKRMPRPRALLHPRHSSSSHELPHEAADEDAAPADLPPPAADVPHAADDRPVKGPPL